MGVVTAPSVEAPRPAEFPSDDWGEEGYRGSLEYHELDQPATLAEIPSSARTPTDGPFTSQGAVKQEEPGAWLERMLGIS